MLSRRLVALGLLALFGFAPSLRATWAILIVDLRTGEIAIGSATCVLGVDLRALTPIMVVGKGIAVAQAFDDTSGANDAIVFRELSRATPPMQILQMLAQRDPQHRYRQYAILDTAGQLVTHTGSAIGGYKGAVTGRQGTMVYAIVGNLLTGDAVLTAAERAVLETRGDIPQKLMAGMQAARGMGGDGRCSCDARNPDRCGAPPSSFTRTAHAGYMIVARAGDADGPCDRTNGCAQGNYYLNLNVPNGLANGPDPVDALQVRFDAWRRGLKDRPDHHRSVVEFPNDELPADGLTESVAELTLRNHEWSVVPYPERITVTLHASSTAPVSIGSVTDRGGGRYTIPIRAGTAVGVARLEVVADNGAGRPVTLAPMPIIAVHGDRLWVSRTRLPGATGADLDFVYRPGAAAANTPWLLLASASGARPGIVLGPGMLLPLNPDPLLVATFAAASAGYPPLRGVVPASGRVTTTFSVPPTAGATQYELSFAAITWPPGTISNPVTVRAR